MRTKISPLDALIATACTGLLLALLTFAALATAFAANEARPYHAEGELLVKFKGGPRGAAAERARDRMKHEVKRNFRHVGWQLIRLPQGMTVEEAMSVYQQLPDVLAVEPNFILGGADPLTNSVLDLEIASVSSAPNDPRFGSQWNLRVIGMTNAWAVTAGSPEVVVAVLDSGIDYTHEDLRDNMWRNPGETGLDPQGRDKATNGIDDDGNGHTDDVFGIDVVDNDSDPMDLGEGQPRTTGFFHGTACAGIIGARGNNGVGIAGVAWSVRMMAIRIAPTNNQIPLGNHLAGVEYMIAMKQRGVNLRASNHSYGGAVLFSQAWYDAGLSIEAEGVVAVHAAGNIGLDLDKLSRIPVTVDLPLLINVAASENTDALASNSNFGRSTVDLAAPGTDPPTTQPANRYITALSGTSFAAPHVAGAIALIAAANPDASPRAIRAALMHSVDQNPSFTNKVVTHGRLNVGRALEILGTTAMPPIVVAATPTTSRTRQSQLLEVWFSQPMDRASTEVAFEVNPPVPGTFVWADDDTRLQFVRSQPFAWTNHTARIRGTAMALSGLTLDGNFNRRSEGITADDYVWTFGFAPANDDFENAQTLVGETGSAMGTTYNASWQVGEGIHIVKRPAIYPGAVWYRWTAERDGWITFETTAASVDTMLEVRTGTNWSTQVDIAHNDDYGTRLASRVSFGATAGTHYYVMVPTLHPNDIILSMGPFTLQWYPTPPPSISNFTPSTIYPGQTTTFNGADFTGATRVLFNGVPADFTFSTNAAFTDLQLTATVPANAVTGPISIETPHGTITTTSNFTVLMIPRLSIQALPGNRLDVSWPSTTGFNLQRAESFTSNTAWAAVSILSSRLTNGIRYVTVTNAVPSRFFRLYRP